LIPHWGVIRPFSPDDDFVFRHESSGHVADNGEIFQRDREIRPPFRAASSARAIHRKGVSPMNHRIARTVQLGALVAIFALVPAALAAKGGHNAATPSAPCTMSGNVVYGSGLPTDQVINFMVTDASGTWGFVLGYTHDGTWSVNVPASNGSTTYEFVSRTYGPAGTKYNVFQSCSV
jgi:hypothetical protein